MGFVIAMVTIGRTAGPSSGAGGRRRPSPHAAARRRTGTQGERAAMTASGR